MVNRSQSAAEDARLSSGTIIAAMRELMRVGITRRGRSALAGYLVLKARENSPGATIEIRSSGEGSVRPELDRFFRLAPGAPKPYVNPFGTREGRPEWLRPGWERAGLYTWLSYSGRALASFVDVETGGGDEARRVSLRATTAEDIAGEFRGGQKVPLEPTAALLLHGEVFPQGADRATLIERFRQVFHLTDHEISNLFEQRPEFDVAFDITGFAGGLTLLPADLHPPTPRAGQAEAARAVEHRIGLAPRETSGLIFDDRVLRRARRALARTRAIALIGPPGTGKSSLVDKLTEEARADPDRFALAASPQFDRYTAEADWTARNVIGGYFPQPDGRLVFQEGYLLKALRHNRWLVIDEMNRADLDRVLGPMLTFLAGQHVDLGPTELGGDARPMLLAIGDEPDSEIQDDGHRRVYLAGTDWRFIGTYNNVDLGRVFSMGAALTRRWATIPVPPLAAERLPETLAVFSDLPISVIEQLKALYRLHLDALPLGPAPFVDMARYVVTDTAVYAASVADELELLRDAYVVHLGPQLRRLAGEARVAFFEALAGILGTELANEIDATF